MATPLALATGLFLVSLAFRSVDNVVCDVVPIGSHFLWHVLNALLLYVLMSGLIEHSERRSQAKSEGIGT
jgi:hypothetical protein